ncbi:MAG: alpha-2-macroglobulin family protein [Thiovulaceae bacterium]|nr:alpha-2-macroglobulin family protein [Sulfurimonadaceae bacterium]
MQTKITKILAGTIGAAVVAGAVFWLVTQEKNARTPQNRSLTQVKLQNIIPSGVEVPLKGEIVFSFDSDVVPLGKMARQSEDILIEFTPELACEWRWISRSSLACKLKQEDRLKAATTYKVSVPQVFSKVDPLRLEEPLQMQFETIRPRITSSNIVAWKNSEQPYVELYANIPVTKKSVQRSIAFYDPLTQETIPSEIIERKVTQGEEETLVEYVKDEASASKESSSWIVLPQKNLGVDRSIELRLMGELRTAEGNLPSQEGYTTTIDTYPEFTFLGVSCDLTSGSRELLSYEMNKEEFESDAYKCDPLGSIGLVFSAPVTRESIAKNVTFVPSLNRGLKDYDPWEEGYGGEYYNPWHRQGREYTVWLPTYLQADATHTFTLAKEKVRDMFARALQEDISFRFRTDHRKPKLDVPYRSVVLEKGLDTDAALYATNLENISFDYVRLDAQRATHDIPTLNIKNLAYKTKMELRKTLGADASGVVFGRVRSDSIATKYPPELFAQVTPFAVHAKLGYFNTLVWVTDFAQGKGVEGVKAGIYYGSYDQLGSLKKLPFEAQSDGEGKVLLAGRDALERELAKLGIKEDYRSKFFIKVEKGKDVALLPLDYDFQIYSSGVYPYQRNHGEHAMAWGTTAQGVYKLGDTVEYKIYVRDQNNTSLESFYKNAVFDVCVYDPLDTLVYENKEVKLNRFGALEGTLNIPKQGASGRYRFEVKKIDATPNTWHPMSFLVSDFTPASFSVKTSLNKERFSQEDQLEVSVSANMFSGGAYTNAPVRITGHLKEKRFQAKDPKAKGFYFTSNGYDEMQLLDVRENLDAKGEFLYDMALKESRILYGTLLFEASVQDERGKFVASSTSADYAQRDRFVGLKTRSWVYEKGIPSAVDVLVVDAEGMIQKGTKVDVQIQYKEYKSARVKSGGNAFVYSNSETWVDEGSCSVVSSNEPLGCAFTPQHTGSYRFVAQAQDTKNRALTSEIYTWVSGNDVVAWNQSNDATLEIIPQEENYKVGDTAKYLIKNPFPKAQALISIERYGVIESWVETFEGSTHILEFKVKPEYIPGYYLSVTLISPRVAQPLGEGFVDLGKPSYKMGYVTTTVNDTYKQLQIKLQTDKEVYRPREKVELTIEASKTKGQKQEPYEFAVAVVDQSVLALNKAGMNYYDPYKGFNKLESLDLVNYNLISRLVGRQNFEKKGANQGGDGGGEAFSNLRNNFKFVAYWNPSVVSDAQGRAQLSFELPDNLTGYSVIVLGVNKNDVMGMGQGSFKVNKETEIRSVMPNQVLEGDSFDAGFVFLNRTAQQRTLDLLIETTDTKGEATRQKASLKVEPYGRETFFFPVTTKESGTITFKVEASDKYDKDAFEHKLSVKKRVSLETAANFGSTTDATIKEALRIPKDIYANVGSIGVVLSSTVIGNIDGAFAYLKEYPYWCWEQRLSKGMGASNFLELKEYLQENMAWEGADALIKQMLADAATYQAPNGGMAFWIGANEYVNPYLSAFSALSFEWLRAKGYQIDDVVASKLHGYLKNFLMRNEAPSYYSQGMVATIRAVALHALAKAGEINAAVVERYYSHTSSMSIFGKAHFLQALLHTRGDAKMQEELLDALLAASTQSSGKMEFNETLDSAATYLLGSNMRTNCTVLSTLLLAEQESNLLAKIKNKAPLLVRTITQFGGGKSHWNNTQENLYCMNALIDYARVYEKEEPSMDVAVRLDAKLLGTKRFASKKEGDAFIAKTIEAEDLGKDMVLEIEKKGAGRLYYSSRLSYAPTILSAEPINAGFEIYREYMIEENGKWKKLASPIEIKRGDIVRIDLFVSLASPKYFTVLNDYVPGGLEPINADLATSSQNDAQSSDADMPADSRWHARDAYRGFGGYYDGFYHKELRHDVARFYADYLPAGDYHLSYTAQAIASGSFSVMPAHAEEMYDPDVFGKTVPLELQVR